MFQILIGTLIFSSSISSAATLKILGATCGQNVSTSATETEAAKLINWRDQGFTLLTHEGYAERGDTTGTKIPITDQMGIVRAKTQFFQTADGNDGVAPTNAAREKRIQQAVSSIYSLTLAQNGFGGTPGDSAEMTFIPAVGVKAKYIHYSDYHANRPARIEVGGLGKSGILRGTWALPTAAHVGYNWRSRLDNFRNFAANDQYNLTLTVLGPPKGASTYLEQNRNSLGGVTLQETEFKFPAPGTLMEVYYQRGSNGQYSTRGGYISGKVMEFVWDGT